MRVFEDRVVFDSTGNTAGNDGSNEQVAREEL
jgi:hypothetical protein